MTLKFLFTLMIRDIFMAVSNQGYPNVFHFFSELFFFFFSMIVIFPLTMNGLIITTEK